MLFRTGSSAPGLILLGLVYLAAGISLEPRPFIPLLDTKDRGSHVAMDRYSFQLLRNRISVLGHHNLTTNPGSLRFLGWSA